MKYKYFTYILLFFCLTFMVFSVKAGTEEVTKSKTIKIKCTEMTCIGCKKKITGAINNLEGIKKIKVDLDTKIITVTFDETKTGADKILSAIAEAGYESELIE